MKGLLFVGCRNIRSYIAYLQAICSIRILKTRRDMVTRETHNVDSKNYVTNASSKLTTEIHKAYGDFTLRQIQ